MILILLLVHQILQMIVPKVIGHVQMIVSLCYVPKSGWSCKTKQFQTLHSSNRNDKITEQERKTIIDVISRAQQSDEIEKKRIGKMIERLKNMKRNARGDGHYTCILCNESFGFFNHNAHECQGCSKLVCNKCGVDTINHQNETIWFCKICSEITEILKKSGSFFHEVKQQLESENLSMK
ncbi:rab effector Noc2-like isoform X1 [Dermatophagoides pteronyssinus]|uniref:rab effector Noc2-like isoform X1 n=1 Tax=Dermatophagoides pteronyssinus TaxID=6956 RepID=UPI003F66F907